MFRFRELGGELVERNCEEYIMFRLDVMMMAVCMCKAGKFLSHYVYYAPVFVGESSCSLI